MRYLIAEKQIQVLNRTLRRRNLKPLFTWSDRFFFASFHSVVASVQGAFHLIKPKTVMAWYHDFLKLRWTHTSGPRGRRPISQTIKDLVLTIKKSNLFFGLSRIKGELLKVNIELGRTTIQRILHEHRKNGKLQPLGTWRSFLKAHWDSLFTCDFFTVDGAFGQCWYVFFMIELKTRRIVQWGITQNPTKVFVQQQLIAFKDNHCGPCHLIHDHGPELLAVDYPAYGITSVPTVIASPNLNAYAERFVRSARRECLDHFIIVTERQLRNIVRQYLDYYNHRRPHQGLTNRIPSGCPPDGNGAIKSRSILFGLYRDFYRSA